MTSRTVRVYTTHIQSWDTITFAASADDDGWTRRVVLTTPVFESGNHDHANALSMDPATARKIARRLVKTANLIDPPKPRAKKGDT